MESNVAVSALDDIFCLSPRVVSSNWRKALFCLQLILLLYGDIYLNPGPEYPCSNCGLNVDDDSKALCCDDCDQWIHVSCDQYVSEPIYDYANPSTDSWYCCSCIDLTVNHSSPLFFVVFVSMHEVYFQSVLHC